MRYIFIVIAVLLLVAMIKENKKGGLLEWIIIIVGLISGISLIF